MLLAHFVGDTCSRQPHELGEGRVWPTRAAGQGGNEARHCRVAVTIEDPQVDCMKEVGTKQQTRRPPLRQRSLNNRSS